MNLIIFHSKKISTFFLISIFAIIFFSNCNNKVENKPPEKILLKYTNGQIFCEGVYKITNSEKKYFGIWKFYFPNGTLEKISEYDKNGKLINEKEYREDGSLFSSNINSDDSYYHSYFYYSGKIRSEFIGKSTTEKDSNGDDVKTSYETSKEYYENGILKEQKETIDDLEQGHAKLWDSSGSILIDYEYLDGFIIQK